jgi:hypothetical protein
MMEFKGTSAKIVETMDAESASLWRQGISKDSAEFKQFLEKISGTKEEA